MPLDWVFILFSLIPSLLLLPPSSIASSNWRCPNRASSSLWIRRISNSWRDVPLLTRDGKSFSFLSAWLLPSPSRLDDCLPFLLDLPLVSTVNGKTKLFISLLSGQVFHLGRLLNEKTLARAGLSPSSPYSIVTLGRSYNRYSAYCTLN